MRGEDESRGILSRVFQFGCVFVCVLGGFFFFLASRPRPSAHSLVRAFSPECRQDLLLAVSASLRPQPSLTLPSGSQGVLGGSTWAPRVLPDGVESYPLTQFIGDSLESSFHTKTSKVLDPDP